MSPFPSFESSRPPIWRTTLEVPAGWRVQDVTLANRSGLVEYKESGWTLPVYDDNPLTEHEGALVGSTEDAVFPDPDVPFAWQVLNNPDGASTSGLLLRKLHDLIGPIAFTPVWDSTDAPEGDYRVVVVLKDADDGTVLARDEVGLRPRTLESRQIYLPLVVRN